jgi:hypothetical protein
MVIKRKFAIFSILIGGAIVLLVGAIAYRAIIAPLFGAQEVPSELREARVVTGADFLTKSEFYRAASKRGTWRELLDPNKIKSRFDSIENMTIGQLDGQPGKDIGLVGRFGVTLLDEAGRVEERINYQFQKGTIALGPFKLARIKDSFRELRLIDVEGDGVCEVLGYDGIDGAALFDHQGRVLFNRGEYEEGKSSIKKVAAGDVDGDGVLEFVASWGYEPWEGLELFDRFGNIRWRHEKESVTGQLEAVDINGDGKAEFVEEDSTELKIRDAHGKVLSSAKMPVFLWHLSLCPRPEGEGPPQDLAVREGSLWLIDLDGKNFSQFDAPLSLIKLEKPRKLSLPGESAPLVFDKEEVYRAKGAWVKLDKEQPKYLAVIATFGTLDRSLLYVYDAQGKLVYQEILPEECNGLVILSPANEGGREEFLISGEKTVWRYTGR